MARRSPSAPLNTAPKPAYGKTAPCTPTPGSGTSPEAVTAAISGLSADTTYHFRIVAENANTTKGEGTDETFKTSAPPPANPPTAVTGEASAVTETVRHAERDGQPQRHGGHQVHL